ncbi:unnamed protein product [Strongylus vulgaris]|uniref:EB domain-containing protein n=1 Tax=Strongylus vulgaris TaxID=40348 RepID=A0A3P7J7E0_STRVU|nr:unnamed protein product [Strongylus vulgaris]
MDGLLAADPDGNPAAFLSCQSNGADSSGYWERRVCPDSMVFDFINQQCQQRKHRKQPLLNIANGQWSNAGAGRGNANPGVYPAVNNFNELLPKPSVEAQPYIFQPNLYATSTNAPVQVKKVPTLARPGQSCRENEMCIGGSICTFPIALCLCPGELEERDGECVLPPSASIPIEKGPGELCDNGEVCVRGSVCDTMIPVCVCPPNTDLSNGDCVHISSLKPTHAQPQPAFTPSPTLAPVYVPPTTQRPQQPSQSIPYGGQNGQYNSYQEKPLTAPVYPEKPLTAPVYPVRSHISFYIIFSTAHISCTPPPPISVVYPGQVGCRSDLQCSAAYTGTKCVDRVCVCPEGYKEVDQTCVPGIAFRLLYFNF